MISKLGGTAWWFPGSSVVRNLPANAGDMEFNPWVRIYSGENDILFQYPCLGNPMDRGAWWATVHRVSRVRYNLATKQQHMLRYRDVEE